MANLILKPSTGGVLKIQNDDGTVDALSVSTGGNLTAAGTLGVTGAVTASSTLGVTGNTTLSGTANNLGTVTAGTISTGATIASGVHGNYVLEDVQLLRNTTEYSTTTSSLTAQTLTGTGTTEGVNFISITTGSSTSDLLEFVCDFGCCRCDAATSGSAYMGFGMQRSASTNMSSPTVMWRSGEHTWGGHDFQDRYLDVVLTRTHTVADWSLAANTTYKINLIGMTHSPSITAVWGLDTATNGIFTDGFKLTYRRWRLL